MKSRFSTSTLPRAKILTFGIFLSVVTPSLAALDSTETQQPTPTQTAAADTAESDEFGADWPKGSGREDTGYLCSACHSLAIVKQQGLKREDWDELLDWMVEEQGMAELEGTDRKLVLDYLAENFNVDRKLK